MDFSYTPRLEELKARAAALTQRLMAYEDECERDGSLTPARLAEIRGAVLESGLNAINMPAEWGGAGLTVLEQVVVQEELGKLTNAIWDCVWRPANPLRHCTPAQRERWLAPGIRGERRDAVAITEAEAGSDPSGIATTATPDGDGWRIDGVKWFVTVGDVADHLLVLAMADGGPTMFIVDKDLPGVVVRRVPAYTHTFVFEHPEFGFEGVRVGPEALLGEVGGGYELTRDWFTEERLMIGARTIGAAARGLPAHAVEQGLRGHQLGRHVGEHELDRLERHDRPSELLALGRERQREIQRPSRRADCARADHEPLLDEPVLRELVATADPAEDPVLADPDALEREDRVLEHERVHVLRRAHEPDSRRVLVDEEHRRLCGVAVHEDV